MIYPMTRLRPINLNICILLTSFYFSTALLSQTDTTLYRLRLQTSLIDLPQNSRMPYHYPTMQQSLEWGTNCYEVAFWGIESLGNRIFRTETHPSFSRKAGKFLFNYGTALAFSRYGSELPIPLGVWTHEEFHRSVLGAAGINSKNGNWLLNRWDGTVYGIHDSVLTNLKATDNDQLLYSYVAGVQSEILFNQQTSIQDFYYKRTFPKNAFLLYNAWYTWNYFKFSTGSISDSVKVLAPPHENSDPTQRDYAGADLTAWAYDMFNPSAPYTDRDSFPNGNGVNRRIGFSDLSPEAQTFLKDQKQLSLLNFLNPGIFFINRIGIGENTSFTVFAQYAPTHFGNAVSGFLPVKYKHINALFAWHRYTSQQLAGNGFTIGLTHYPVSKKLFADMEMTVWKQPVSFMSSDCRNGAALQLRGNLQLNSRIGIFASFYAKSAGWHPGNPYLRSSSSFRAGLFYHLAQQSHS